MAASTFTTQPADAEGGQGALKVVETDVAPSLSALNGQGHDRATFVATAGVRRLTPTECERLQALPDGWTDFGPDSRRYAALGDAVTASVSEWIGNRILKHERPRRAAVS